MDETQEGVEIVLTPIQLAAVLEGESIEESASLSNSFWGAVSVVVGALELAAGSALLLTPEPTTLTKLGGGALFVHGTDTMSTGWYQVVSGRTRVTVTAQAVTAAAEFIGADPADAKTIGSAVDLAVPMLGGFVGMARAGAIRGGRVVLTVEEAAGGHTIARHIAKTEADLQARLLRQKGIKAASSFRTLDQAETAVSAVLRHHQSAVKAWAKSATVGTKQEFVLEFGKSVGFGVVRATGKVQEMTKVVVVLRRVQDQNRIYFVLTAYPGL